MPAMPWNSLLLAVSMTIGLTAGYKGAAQAAEVAYAWANQPTAGSYEPAPLYAFNPFGSVQVSRQGTGRYTIVFENFGIDTDDGAGMGGHVQVSAYRTADRCTIERWNFRQPDFTINVLCFEGGAASTPADARFTVMAMFGIERRAVLRMEIGTPEIDALQADIGDLQTRVANLVERIRVLEGR